MAIRLAMHDSAPFAGERPPRMEQVKCLGEYVIVNETRVDGKQAHEKNNISPAAIPLSDNSL